MSRATPADVKLLLPSLSLTDEEIQMWLDVAFCIIENVKNCINGSEDKLKQIEIYLSAHFITLLNPGGGGALVTSEKTKELATTYATQQNISESINTTTYGTAASAMSGGCLANYDKPKATVEFF